MTTSEYLINAALIGVVVLQLRGRRLSVAQLAWPLGLVAFFAVRYLHTAPTAGNDLTLIGAGVAAGLTLGTGSGLLTRIVHSAGNPPVAKATVPAALLWVAGVGARMGFALYAQHGGGPAIARFSFGHDITSGAAWVDALVLMALVEVVARTTLLAWRAYRAPLLAWATRRQDGSAGEIIRSS